MGHSRNRGASIQSRISPSRERCGGAKLGPLAPPRMASRASWFSFSCVAGSVGEVAGTLVPFKAIAQAAHRDDLDAAGFEFLAQPMHIDLDGAGADFFAPFAEVVHQLRLADHAAAARQEDLEQADLAGGEIERLVVDQGHAAGLVEDQPAMAQELGSAD